MEDFAYWNLAEGRFVGFEPRRNNKTVQKGNSPWKIYMTIGGTPTVRTMLLNSYKMHLWVDGPLLYVETREI
jgi:hypothetical protein